MKKIVFSKYMVLAGVIALLVFFVMTLTASAATRPNGMQIVNSIDSGSGSSGFVINGDKFYTTGYVGDIFAVRSGVTNPANLAAIDSHIDAVAYDGPRNVALSGTTAYVVSQDGGTITSFDVSDNIFDGGDVLDTLGSLTEAWDIAVDGNWAFVSGRGAGDGLYAIDISNPASLNGGVAPSAQQTLNAADFGSFDQPSGIAIYGTTAFVAVEDNDNNGSLADGSGGVIAVDISDPAGAGLSVLGAYTSPDLRGARDIVISSDGKTAFLALVASSGAYTVASIDITNPTTPTLKDIDNTGSTAWGIGMDGDYLYVTDPAARRLHAYDVTDPSNITHLESLPTGYSVDVKVAGSYAFVSDYTSGDIHAVELSPSTGGAVSSSSSGDRRRMPRRQTSTLVTQESLSALPVDDIKVFQSFLISQGHGVGMPVDGIVGPLTMDAWSDFIQVYS